MGALGTVAIGLIVLLSTLRDAAMMPASDDGYIAFADGMPTGAYVVELPTVFTLPSSALTGLLLLVAGALLLAFLVGRATARRTRPAPAPAAQG